MRRTHRSRTSRPEVVVVGSSNTDLIIRVARIPEPGETVLGGEFVRAGGGKGANQAMAAARAGGAVTLIARVGCDGNGDDAVADLARAGVDVTHVVRDATRPSGVALILVGRHGENSIAVAPGANDHLRPADVRAARPAFRRARIALLQLEIPLECVEAAVALAAAQGVRLVLNPAPARRLPRRVLEGLYLLTPNEHEAEQLTGIVVTGAASAARAAGRLLARGVRNVVITMGARGAFVAGPDLRRHVPAFAVRAVDTTGAGDVFNGALAVALAEAQPLLTAVRFACAAAAISVTRAGAMPSAPSRRAIAAFLAGRRS